MKLDTVKELADDLYEARSDSEDELQNWFNVYVMLCMTFSQNGPIGRFVQAKIKLLLIQRGYCYTDVFTQTIYWN
jgi:hypothetical protein